MTRDALRVRGGLSGMEFEHQTGVWFLEVFNNKKWTLQALGGGGAGRF